ncbi:hypothetical protein ACFS5L_41175 [Streptomyces phyllanthi]|uniref:Uncharacterized protein n=1 Tax=Streptomyces phyllanthi TaxID=1803180 RepID=A0A5N8VXG3_9ACTN|nr:hypothetical protein [Streptomyces phyllanthi]MPY39406.1 hypothetical protein [Streptomyces phyllanthi]
MGRITVDYDLMYSLARDIWALRDRLLDTSRANHDFAPTDIGPRKQTADSLTDFYDAWKKSFGDAWQVMTDLGNLLDEMGKAFYDQDAQGAIPARQQEAAMLRRDIEQQNRANQQKQEARVKQAKAEEVQARYRTRQALLDKQQAELDKKRTVLENEQLAQQKRQEDLNKQQEALQKKQEPLQRRQEELQREQQELWQEQNARREAQAAAFKEQQDALDKEYEALRKEQEPLQRRQEELQREQQELWKEESDLREKQEAAFLAQQTALQQEQDRYDAKSAALTRKQEDLWKERDALLRKKGVTQAEFDAWQRKQDALWKEQEALWEEEGAPLEKKWNDLEQLEKDQRKEFESLSTRQEVLNKEREELAGEQEPLTKRQDELQEKQQDLWNEQNAERKVLEGDLTKEQDDLNRRQDDLRKDQDALQPESDDLQRQQEDLWKDQAENEKAQDRLDEEEEPLREQSEELQKNRAEELEELERTPASELQKDTGWLRRHREWADDPVPEPSPVPKGLVRETPDGRTEISYKLDENGEIALDKNGQPLETTTTVTNKKNGMVYSETHHPLPGDGDSVTTIRSSDGSVTKVYVDNNPEGYGPGESMRYVTDEKGAAIQTWRKTADGEWGMVWDRSSSPSGEEDAANGVGRPPAYLTVEKPLVDGGGRPADDTFSPPMPTELPDGNTRTDYMRPDGSELRVVTTDTTRYVADGNNEIQEIWYKNRNGDWYLRESITQHTRYGDEPPLGKLGENWQ